ncbi:MAG: uL15 family ribosomal protein [Candidatus Hydrothermarchaeales archaeon]
MARKNRKIRKQRGSRSCGEGSNKRHRGAGNRGGVGMAGTHKSKWTWVIKHAPDHFGRSGFKIPSKAKHVLNAINLWQIEEIANKAEVMGEEKEALGIGREGGKLVIDVTEFDYDKVLGKGTITRPLVVKAGSFSKIAEEKIKGAGGNAIVIGD